MSVAVLLYTRTHAASLRGGWGIHMPQSVVDHDEEGWNDVNRGPVMDNEPERSFRKRKHWMPDARKLGSERGKQLFELARQKGLVDKGGVPFSHSHEAYASQMAGFSKAHEFLTSHQDRLFQKDSKKIAEYLGMNKRAFKLPGKSYDEWKAAYEIARDATYDAMVSEQRGDGQRVASQMQLASSSSSLLQQVSASSAAGNPKILCMNCTRFMQQ